MNRRDAIALGISISVPVLIGAAGSLATSDAIDTWYRDLEKPPWNPPNWVFGPVWTFLYVTMGIAAWLIWLRRARDERVRPALAWYGAQLALNAVWSPVFFGAERPGAALVIIAVLLVLIIETIRRFAAIEARAAWILAPYAGWVAYASTLNAAIWWLNR